MQTLTESQQETAFSFGSFYVGEERVTADLALFVLAAPNGEVEAFSPPSSWTRCATRSSSTAGWPR